MKKLFSVFLAFLLVFFLAIQVKADQIKIKTVDGVQVIENPKKPAPPEGTLSKMTLREEISIGQGEFDEDMFAELTSMDVDSDGNIYILDRKDKKVKIFDSAGKFVKKFGEEGQGPGEMYLPVSIQVTHNNEIVIGDAANQRLMFFSLEGEFLREMSTALKARGLVLPIIDSQGNIIGQQIVTSESQIMREVRKYDSELNSLFTITSIDITSIVQGKINPFELVFFYQLGKDNAIYCSNPNEYEIKVLNTEGKLVKRILKDYDSVKVTDKDKEEFFERVGEVPAQVKDRIEFPDVYPPYQNFTLDEEEMRLFVRTFEKGKEEGEFFLDVFDVEGRCIAKIPFRGEPRAWKGKKLYAVEEDEDGFQILKVYNVQWE